MLAWKERGEGRGECGGKLEEKYDRKGKGEKEGCAFPGMMRERERGHDMCMSNE